jgi:hypothetical protein
MLRLLTVSVCLVTLSHAAFAGPSPMRPGGPRIRPQDTRIARFLSDGLKRSPTMRALVDRIEASNVIVYVGAKPLMKSHLSGALSFVTSAGDYRYVRAMINADLLPDLMIATLAHEFQHVLEVIDAPSVVDDKSLVNLYRSIGVSSTERQLTGWETHAAQAMGAQVRRELLLARTTAVTEVTAISSHDEKM